MSGGPVGVFQFANELCRSAATAVAKRGVESGFWQALDPDPQDPRSVVEIGEQRLDRQQARAHLARRASDGFVGLLGFSCVELEGSRVYVEAFDTRDPSAAPGTAKTVALSIPLKRTWNGKYRPAGQGQLHGEVEPLR